MIKIRPRFPPTHDSCRFRTFFCNNFQSTFNTCTSPKHHTIYHSAHRSFENSLKYSPYQDIFSLKYIHFGYKVGLSFSGLALIFDRFCYRFSHNLSKFTYTSPKHHHFSLRTQVLGKQSRLFSLPRHLLTKIYSFWL